MLVSWNTQGIQAYNGGSVVYLPVLKNASSFFVTNFVKQLRWTPIQFSKIDWTKQHVFGFIQDPIARRHKGVAEYLEITQTDHLLDDQKFQNFVRDIPVLDEHSSSIVEKFGSYAWMVDWIPLDYPNERVIEFTEMMLWSCGIRKIQWDLSYTHPSSQKKKETASVLEKLWNESTTKSQHTQEYFRKDINLYQQVVAKFDPWGDSWPNISWLRERFS